MGLPEISRRRFLAQVGLALAAAQVLDISDLPQVLTPQARGSASELDVLRRITYPSLRYEIPDGMIVRLANTGDAAKYAVLIQGRSGQWVRKTVMIGSLAQQLNRWDDKREVAYQIQKRGKEAARDMAHIEGVDWRTNERTATA